MIDPSTPRPAPASAPFATDALRWAAVRGRDRRAAGAFLYAVRTTGIYCRPGCASRLPRREHVVFFPDRRSAERAGFRPCKRCRPDAAAPDPAASAVALACRRIAEAERPPSLAELAAVAGLSPSHFHRLFTRTVGMTPKRYAAAQRRERLAAGLRSDESVTRAIYDAGYGSASRFYEENGRSPALGMAPAAFRAGARGETIRYAVGPSSLGQVLVAATERGICAVELGDDPVALGASVRRRFPRAALREDPAFADTLRRVIALIDAPGPDAGADLARDLPLDIRGTAFQARVWAALRQIPPGRTATYAEVAAGIGQPRAARAVAAACAANPLAVAVPCHRVVRGDGGLGGYRWGETRKRLLLQRESAAGSPTPDEP